ncbi:MAG: hypothetical protein H0X15_15465, partial [Acidobacteria bacterium]|nr:hypothetical protein [Acidobacteriota bacterium]
MPKSFFSSAFAFFNLKTKSAFHIFALLSLSFTSFLLTEAQTPTPEQMPRTPGAQTSPTPPRFAPAPQTSPVPQAAAAPQKKDDPLKLFQYRAIGPHRGGRAGAVAGV